MQASAVDFAHALSSALVGADPGDVVGVARAVYAPYEAQIARRVLYCPHTASNSWVPD